MTSYQAGRPIVFIINSLYRAGAERVVVDDINELLKKDIDVRLVTLRPEKNDSTLAEECILLEKHWVKVYFSGWFNLSAWFLLIRQLKNWRPRAVVTHLWFANTIGRIASRLAGVPVIVSFEHNVYDKVKSRIQFAADRMLAGLSQKIVAVSESVQKSLLRHGINKEKITILHNGIKIDRYRGAQGLETRKNLGIKEDEFIFLFIGRLARQKGVDILIKALKKIERGILIVAGEGEESYGLARLTSELGLEQRIKFLGQRRDIPELLAVADCLVLPSRWEGFGMVVLEAMAAGVPVVASAVNGIEEIIRSDAEGLLFEAENTEALSETLRYIQEDGELRRKISLGGSRRVEDFSVERHAQTLLDLVGENL